MSFFFKDIDKTKTVEVGTRQKIIPAGTQLLSAIAGAVWVPADDFYNKRIVVTLHVVEKGEHYGKKVDHKLHVFSDDPNAAKKAAGFLMAYDQNCKGMLSKMEDAGKSFLDNNTALATALNGGQVVVTYGEYRPEDDTTESGYKERPNGDPVIYQTVIKIAPKPGAKAEEKAMDQKAETHGFEEREPGSDDDFGDIF